jgi:hypothetical protein
MAERIHRPIASHVSTLVTAVHQRLHWLGQADASPATRRSVAQSPGARLSWLPKSSVEKQWRKDPQPKGAGISARTVTGYLPLKHQHLFTL